MRRQDFLERQTGAAAGTGTNAGASPGTVKEWNRLALQAIRAARLPAPLAARTLAILHTVMYNAWAAYDDAARQTADGVAVRLPRGERHGGARTVATSQAAHAVLCSRFPAQRATFDARLAQLLRALPPPRTAGTLGPAGIGRVQAASVLDACGQDGAAPPPPAGLAPDCERWCLLARAASEGDDRDVLRFFVLANALDGAVIALHAAAGGAMRSLVLERLPAACGTPWNDACDGAAGEALRRFAAAEPSAEPGWEADWGRALGALVFDRARGYWQGKGQGKGQGKAQGT